MKTTPLTRIMNRISSIGYVWATIGILTQAGEVSASWGETSYCNPRPYTSNCKWQVDAEFLYWYSNITNLAYCLEGETIDSGDQFTRTVYVPTHKIHLDRSWDPGVRIGLGYLNECNCWEINSEWTYFKNCTKSKHEVPAFDNSDFVANDQPFQPVGVKALKAPWFLTPNSDFFNAFSSEWELAFNQIDLELARTFCVCSWMNIRPNIGLRGYWTDITFNVFASRPLRSEATLLRSSSRFSQDNWGIGFLLGIDTSWALSPCFSIFSETTASLAYGRQSITRKSTEFEEDDQNEVLRNTAATTRDLTYKLQPILDMALGVRWEKLCGCYRVFVDVGWEFHYFYNMNQIFRSGGSSSSNEDLIPTNGSLGLSGLTVRGKVEF